MEVKALLDNEIINRTFINEYRRGFVTIDGYVFPIIMEGLIKRIADMEVYDTDVWVTSFPKCGTTWTQEMVWLIANDLDYNTALEQKLESRFPFLESSGLFDVSPVAGDKADSVEKVQMLGQQRFIKSHLPWHMLPNQITNGNKKPKIIHVVRNAKDVCVSYYHHMRLFEGYTGNFEEFCELFLLEKINYQPFWKCISSYWKHRDEPNYLFLSYEDMKNNLSDVIRQVAMFLGKTLNASDVATLEKHLSFDSMKKNQSVNKEHIIEQYKKLNLNVCGNEFIRTGKIGNYKVHMNEEMIKRFDKWSSANMRDLKYLFNKS